ncbi:MAG: 2-amino-4-hydroxy-6-hydroxymethyldihydropteridine diphosphokinase [Firmicutes bacterium]|nr:2-amino-4-hydroxy-6-hydroxymethyldihydropteridine diphosphokinase [Bacillota bacterium]
MIGCYIGLGSNMGRSRDIISASLEMLNRSRGITVTAVAPLYRTEPQGYTEQDHFINTVAQLDTTLQPLALLGRLRQIEHSLGRVRSIHWGPRTLDLDLLLYGEENINLPDLQVPHPRMHLRAFVMAPLADLNPDLIIAGKRAADLARELSRCQVLCCFDK